MMAAQMDEEKSQTDRKLFDNAKTGGVVEEQEKKLRILLAAAALFADKGYAGAPVREIAQAAGVTKPTLYYYFKSKEDLYTELIDLAMETFFQVMKKWETGQESMRTRLLGIYTSIYQLFRDHVDLLRLVNSIIYGPRGATPQYDLKARTDRLERILSDVLERGVAEGELREENRAEVLLLLWGLLRSIQVLLVLNPSQPSLTPDMIGRAIDVIFDGARGSVRSMGEEGSRGSMGEKGALRASEEEV